MKFVSDKISGFISRNTSGFPFFLWAVLGGSIAGFIFYFRDHPSIDFENLKFILLFGTVWFVGSDLAKARKILDEKTHFFLDSVFYIVFFNSIIYFSGGFRGGLMITLVAAMISAPFFAGIIGTIIFASALILSVFGIYFIRGIDVNPYNTGLLIVQLTAAVVVVVMVKYFSLREKKLEKDIVMVSRKEVDFKTRELQKTLEELKKSRETLKDKMGKMEQFQKLVVGRELKMIELKTKIKELEEKLKKESNRK